MGCLLVRKATPVIFQKLRLVINLSTEAVRTSPIKLKVSPRQLRPYYLFIFFQNLTSSPIETVVERIRKRREEILFHMKWPVNDTRRTYQNLLVCRPSRAEEQLQIIQKRMIAELD